MAEIISAAKIPKKCAGTFSDDIIINNVPPQSGIVDTLIRSESMIYTN